jgi:hypothetical protein
MAVLTKVMPTASKTKQTTNEQWLPFSPNFILRSGINAEMARLTTELHATQHKLQKQINKKNEHINP